MVRPFITRGARGESTRGRDPRPRGLRGTHMSARGRLFLQSPGAARLPPKELAPRLLGAPFGRDSSWGASPEDTGTLDAKAGAARCRRELMEAASAPFGRFPPLPEEGARRAPSPRQGPPFLPRPRWVSLAARPSHPPSLPAATETRLPGLGRSLRASAAEPPPTGRPPAPHWSSGSRCGAPGSPRPSPRRAESGFAAAAVAPGAAPGSWGAGSPERGDPRTPCRGRSGARHAARNPRSREVRQGYGARSPHPRLQTWAGWGGLPPRRDPRGHRRRTRGARRTRWGRRRRGAPWGRPSRAPRRRGR